MTKMENAASGTPKIRVRKMIVESLGHNFWRGMDDSGDVFEWASATEVVAFVRTRDAVSALRGESTATVIEWRDAPDGFTPPA